MTKGKVAVKYTTWNIINRSIEWSCSCVNMTIRPYLSYALDAVAYAEENYNPGYQITGEQGPHYASHGLDSFGYLKYVVAESNDKGERKEIRKNSMYWL